MKESPILFSGSMIRAILDGRKTQTRRVVKVRGELPPTWATFASEGHSLSQDSAPRPVGSFFWSEEQQPGQPLKSLRRWPTLPKGHPMAGDWYWTPSPFGKVGDRLWVRETFRFTSDFDSDSPARVGERCLDAGYKTAWAPIQYTADGAKRDWGWVGTPPGRTVTAGRVRASMHMPRWASRIALEVAGVRVERLQAISESDAEAEGFDAGPHYTPRGNFANLWECLATPGSHWEANPWVWVIDFKRINGAA